METWFNPPAQQSLFMPGWFDDHFANMSHYLNVGSAGAVVGTRRNGTVWRRLAGNFSFKPHQDDLDRIIEALKRVGRIYFAAGAAAGDARNVPVPLLRIGPGARQKVWTATRRTAPACS